MGNANGRQSGTSSPRHQSVASVPHQPSRTFDGGSLSPHGIYPGRPDYNPSHVLKYIGERRLAPFYKGLDEYEEDWTDYQLSYMVKEGKLPPTKDLPSTDHRQHSSTPSLLLPPGDEQGNVGPSPPRIRGKSLAETSQHTTESSTTNLDTSNKDNRSRPRALTTGSSSLIPTRGKPLEAIVYRHAIECPVCFLYYPPNINRTRCCWKPVCTECFVEMKRAEPHYPTNDDPNDPNSASHNLNLNPMNMVSDPVRCPFCVKSDFGVVYNPPEWLPTERRLDSPLEIATSPLQSDADLPKDKREEMYPPGNERVVLSDDIRPDWYQALAHRRRVEARRLATATALQQALAVAGQRRRVPGSTRPHGTNASGTGAGGSNEPRRAGRRVDGIIRITRDEADEMMLQEAIRRSIQTQEEEQKKREDGERNNGEGAQSPDTTEFPVTPSIVVPRSPASSSSSLPITPSALPRLRPSTSTSPPSPRSYLSAFRDRSESETNRIGTSLPSNALSQIPNRRPSSTTNLSPPTNIVRRQPSLPDALLSSTTASLAIAMHDSIIPSADDSRPSISSPLASQSGHMPSVRHDSTDAPTDAAREGSTPPHISPCTSSTGDDEVLPMTPRTPNPDPGPLKARGDGGGVEEREVVELTH